ncbi:hypothetical protein [Streptomyces natalensis]|uniref:Uncharacterized protein n=1 Tax=Streptomyces natalensis ATCC 27448 TaxID=1240678 RepID=A0A0D7CUU2_9ACTN|nr:hypothetical protein [Streptomyces natalensis]KIZ19806.1 hypothetical protein SNA_00055 [Streptomyces natalensis ATCC 27448]
MSPLDKIKSLFGRRHAQTPDSDRGNANSDDKQAAESAAAGLPDKPRAEGSSRWNAVARGAAEGAARETVRIIFEEFFND